MFERAFVVSSCLSLYCFSPTSTLPLSQSTCSLSGRPSSMSSPPRVKTTALTDNDESQSFFAHTCTGRPVYELLGTWPGMVQETEDGGPGNHDAQARKHDLLGCTQENCTGLRRELRSPVERHNGLSDQEQQAASLRSHFFLLSWSVA